MTQPSDRINETFNAVKSVGVQPARNGNKSSLLLHAEGLSVSRTIRGLIKASEVGVDAFLQMRATTGSLAITQLLLVDQEQYKVGVDYSGLAWLQPYKGDVDLVIAAQSTPNNPYRATEEHIKSRQNWEVYPSTIAREALYAHLTSPEREAEFGDDSFGHISAEAMRYIFDDETSVPQIVDTNNVLPEK